MSKKTASSFVSSFSELPKLIAAIVASPREPKQAAKEPAVSAEVEHMRDSEDSEITRGDVHELFGEMIVTDAFQSSFGDPLPLTIIEPGDEEGEHFMPDAFAAQAECGGIIATIFDLFTDTRLDPLAQDIAWGFVNSFHFVTKKLERQEDRLAETILDMTRRIEPSEVFNSELEQKQLECQSVAEQRAAIGAMCDYAAAMYRACSGRAWAPARGSKPAYVTTDALISALDYLRARAEERRDRHNPKGPKVLISGPLEWHDWNIIWERLSLIKTRIPHMVLVETGGKTGVAVAARTWAAAEGVPCIEFGLFSKARSAPFDRNRQVADEQIIEAVICEGTGIQDHLFDLLNPKGDGRKVPTHVIKKDEQAPDTEWQKAKRRRVGAEGWLKTEYPALPYQRAN